MNAQSARTDPVSDRRLLRQNVFERLLAEIIDGRLAPGRRLRDDELTALLGVSRTPLREALARLDGLGLVQTAPNRFTRVAPLASESLFEVIDLLDALVPLLVRRIVERLDDDTLLEAEYLERRIARLPVEETTRAVGLLLSFGERLLDDLELIPSVITSAMLALVRYAVQRPVVLIDAGGIPAVQAVLQALLDHDPAAMNRHAEAFLRRLAGAIRATWSDAGASAPDEESVDQQQRPEPVEEA
ncbi:GntR family transcriptional regulator [Plantibacter sp. ME-Dv--P-095]|uniref:GntR family transcriptional regulator n=1 Tax=Plantibacter sp. ME-Dv--P-095 TaxID=3040299 RepID=UPI0025501F89|nr:GntR family transcriptional regulator [Plantibacter sp. ME-Dv--P-095]